MTVCPTASLSGTTLAHGAAAGLAAQRPGYLQSSTSIISGGQRLTLRGGCAEADADAGGAAAAAGEEKKEFSLDAWKRLYSNTEDTATIMGEFWDMFDKEGWSMWYTEYKNNDDYEKRIMASNLIGGWFQRLDATGTRKVAFGNVHVFGDEPKLEIAGCWLVKGQEVPQEFKDVVDYEQWDWIKVDTDSEEERKACENYMCWDEEGYGKGRKWCAGKTYK
eukprot:CAMPEP_0173434648 /NCGR_PEP_ID=MMETSP1357-20121228/13165_1 /TAXON_ID=77926 /ORGANISM="Hemiselmis rufescens, Strain PCC563" /LENGTH=219 /DNA_ID=CAMNT_0014399531 /DNA_START=37 /DNA_END=696 /DNA_ORIENTATION=-